MGRFLLILLGCVFTFTDVAAVIVSDAPKDVEARALSDLAGSKTCQEMFLATKCKDNPNYCRPKEEVAYQGWARNQDLSTVFAIARDMKGAVRICTWDYSGSSQTWRKLEKATLKNCENIRKSFTDKYDMEFQDCEVYARDNIICKEPGETGPGACYP